MGAIQEASESLRRLHVEGREEGGRKGSGEDGQEFWLRVRGFHFWTGQEIGRDGEPHARHQALEHAF